MKLDNCKKTIAARQRFHNRQKQKILRVANLRIATAAKSRAGFEDQMLALCKLWCDSVRTVEDVVMTGYDSRDEELSALTAGEPQDVEMTNAADDEDDSEDSLMADVGDEMAVDAVNNTTTDVEMVI
ncbi:hypothetical protein VFPFJ_04984 [Purpureocillium lilacinum]|uniref:Uncharacterized protein n=2 Tax=Purpureocillium lilacinum TaxID=33203 RepID=A0A179HKB5_PURLI|nr:hypothetical protein VFPFJ_04984 [Purpureocillium lilacinum]KAK4085744.1 hypothetical protein Purlil1_9904 [Purpureocillium lilacinum]OAQ90825.1 hypothetical protein VFPFJ_04984 [Purpureocillium lilacinum]GJN68363.1 hypothetical protein PLICBS_002406 [Purpureocillium lilacinum]GJN77962.1 hypothetical protein PLIIFM63780_001455 [Purpureocillium lilacinum]